MFYSFDLDLDPMTLILNIDPDMVKMYLHTKNKVCSYSSSKGIALTDRHTHIDKHTDRHTYRETDSNEIITYRHAQMEIKMTALQHCGIATH